MRWGGVAPAVLLDQAGVKPEAKYAVFHAHGGVYLSTLPLDLVRDSQTMLADSLNGAPLPPKHGGPLRLVVPKQLGYKSVKWVERIELTERGEDRLLGGERLPGGRAGPGQLSACVSCRRAPGGFRRRRPVGTIPRGRSRESPGAVHWSPRRSGRAPDQSSPQEAEDDQVRLHRL